MPSPVTAQSGEIIGLCDAHAYYVSCHRLFEPRLQNMPVVVLSNNDSAVVSRSDEAKALGIKMSQPRHEIEWMTRRHGLIMRSSNYPLYQDIHRRMIAALTSKVGSCAPYSIDEAWVRLTGMPGDLAEVGASIRNHVQKTVGIPVGVGISRNCTTAKLANWASKKWKRQTGSVVVITESERLQKLMALAEVGEVWGIGRRLTDHLNSYGITTALQLANADAKHLRRLHGVGLARTVRELNWEYCISPDEDDSPRKSMTCSRTFPAPISSLSELASYLATFAATVGRKLRREGMLACAVRIFLQPSRSSTVTVQGKSVTIGMVVPTNDSRILIEASMDALKACYTSGGAWIRAGLMVVDAISETHFIPDLFAPESRPRSQELMLTLDRINRVSGEGTIRFGSEHRKIGQHMRRQYPSNRFTTSWIELPEAT
ncbi:MULTISPECIES: Y-family DNA polymerase [Pseudomonas]|uniref:Y-family DNA polymerase n=1 Tax=Pseudomonas TaxID=286 RepID=UPI000AD39594|nr:MULTISPECIES: Y-family DNA polymerase [Pseudomonas]WHS57646.1 Y-family DNA polymerase [Pseudomonas brassicacearum]WNZ87605.1 Y-family DNA polymerase [Pseudomonas sp. P108]